MIELHPDGANPGSLWGGAQAAKREAETPRPDRNDRRTNRTLVEYTPGMIELSNHQHAYGPRPGQAVPGSV
jgi:hypothetical protein